MLKGISWSSLLLLGATAAVGLMAGCGDDDDTTTTNTGPTGPSSSSSSDASSSSSSGGGMGGSGGTGGMAAGGSGGTGGSGGGAPDFTPLASGNVLVNDGFENFTSPGGQPPFDPADTWVNFGARLTPAFEAIQGGYVQHATQADGADIFPTTDPFPGLNGTRALKVFGIALGDGNGNLEQTLGTIYQEYMGASLPPVGSQLRLTGWAYHASQDPLGPQSQAYLVIKCFGTGFTEQCGAGGQKSVPVTSTTAADGWVQYVVDLPATNADTTIIQAGVEFEQCLGGVACSGADGAGAVFFDDLVFSYE